MIYTERFERPVQAPSVEQLLYYRNFLVGMVRSMRKGVRKTSRYPDAEFMMPGSFTQRSNRGEAHSGHIERDRTYSVAYRYLGMDAHKLMVLETDSTLLPKDSGNALERYRTDRRVYRFNWSGNEVTNSNAVYTEIISDATFEIDLEEAKDDKVYSVSDLDLSTDPFRMSEYMLVDDKEYVRLLDRTVQYKEEYFEELGIRDDIVT